MKIKLLTLLVLSIAQLSFAQNFNQVQENAQKGDKDAQLLLGMYYVSKKNDFDKGFLWLKKSAEQGEKEAQYFLGYLYEIGAGTTKDAEKAFYWYKISAEQGQSDAQNALAGNYFLGGDLDQAYYWWKKSAAQGNEIAQKQVDILKPKLEPSKSTSNEVQTWGEVMEEKNKEEALRNLDVLEVQNFIQEKNISNMIPSNISRTKPDDEIAIQMKLSASSSFIKKLNTGFYHYIRPFEIPSGKYFAIVINNNSKWSDEKFYDLSGAYVKDIASLKINKSKEHNYKIFGSSNTYQLKDQSYKVFYNNDLLLEGKYYFTILFNEEELDNFQSSNNGLLPIAYYQFDSKRELDRFEKFLVNLETSEKQLANQDFIGNWVITKSVFYINGEIDYVEKNEQNKNCKEYITFTSQNILETQIYTRDCEPDRIDKGFYNYDGNYLSIQQENPSEIWAGQIINFTANSFQMEVINESEGDNEKVIVYFERYIK